MDIFKKLKELNFPEGQYVVVGSGLLAAFGLREANDLDVAVNGNLLKSLIESDRYRQEIKYDKLFLIEEGMDILTQLDWEAYPTTVDEAIKTAVIIRGYPFLNPTETIKFKKALGRAKDFRDIKLLEDYLDKK